MARIRILIGSHLCIATRAQREARALVEAGHDVTIQGAWYDKVLAARDERLLERAPYHFEAVVDLRRTAMLPRLRRRLGVESWRRLRRFSPSSLGYGVREHLRVARAAAPDLTIAHSVGGLWAVAQLAKSGHRIGVDFENWFSECIRPEDARRQPVEAIRQLERNALRLACYRLAPTRALARALADQAAIEPPTAVYNGFALADLRAPAPPAADRRPTDPPSLHWFSNEIEPGRGLETLFAALPHIQYPAEVHLRGALSRRHRRWLSHQIPESWRARVKILPVVHDSELLPRIASHDIGLVFEPPALRGRDLTIPKKTFHFLLAGLAVLGTDTTGHREIATAARGALKLFPADDPAALAAAIDAWLAFPEHLKLARLAAVQATKETFCWERMREQLLDEAALALA